MILCVFAWVCQYIIDIVGAITAKGEIELDLFIG